MIQKVGSVSSPRREDRTIATRVRRPDIEPAELGLPKGIAMDTTFNVIDVLRIAEAVEGKAARFSLDATRQFDDRDRDRGRASSHRRSEFSVGLDADARQGAVTHLVALMPGHV